MDRPEFNLPNFLICVFYLSISFGLIGLFFHFASREGPPILLLFAIIAAGSFGAGIGAIFDRKLAGATIGTFGMTLYLISRL